ncbi:MULTISPECIES: GreA/GreB family elongation factor [Flavobacteriaceae]|jgi:regulator of nucleoside diphosphate kinase|uniref:Transcription elongation factor GreA/GreB C-terminal domain-containing protein n=2 Tax=Flavobacteriaceae TaxID=49546 RepID=A0ABP3UZU4_9FLAO|nr:MULTISPECIES: GreA/GreB family elongation factor [Flavobacteriaceae]RYH74017.1 GreA/GreB family elongation factor [Flavobacteriaceae bacterium 144Ye]TBV25979.1 transcription elongation factor GreAB [Meridianimaribacter sp. CL38]TDY11353.1 regulator of nucleoside diphosphate kinase [Meridianimaribacter flavus]
MKYGSLILEKKEYVYLKRILNISGYAEDHETQKCLMSFSEELKTAHIVDHELMPTDIVRFNSMVTVAFSNDIQRTIQVVTPIEKDFKSNKISVLTPLGSALFGYSEGDTVLWDFPNGKQEVKIVKVEQEETLSDVGTVI